MSYDDKIRPPARANNIIMEGRAKLMVSGVEDVESFDENEIIMLTTQGSLIIRGSGLRVEKLSVDTGDICILGLFSELCYEEVAVSGSLWSRLFK